MPELKDALSALGINADTGTIVISSGEDTSIAVEAGDSPATGTGLNAPALNFNAGSVPIGGEGHGGDVYIQPGSGRGTGETGGHLYLDAGSGEGGLATRGFIILGQNGASLPTADPAEAGALWLDVAAGLVLKVSAG